MVFKSFYTSTDLSKKTKINVFCETKFPFMNNNSHYSVNSFTGADIDLPIRSPFIDRIRDTDFELTNCLIIY
jgi:hypothetical protein